MVGRASKTGSHFRGCGLYGGGAIVLSQITSQLMTKDNIGGGWQNERRSWEKIKSREGK